jgi:hypothetical protein
MEKKFPILHVVSAIFKILAWIVALGDILAIIALLTHKAGLPSMFQTANFTASPYVLALLALLFGVFYFILLYAMAEGIMVVLAIEQNTRKALKDKPQA